MKDPYLHSQQQLHQLNHSGLMCPQGQVLVHHNRVVREASY